MWSRVLLFGVCCLAVGNSQDKVCGQGLQSVKPTHPEWHEAHYSAPVVCYDVVGCFKNTFPWRWIGRPIPVPMPPDQMGTNILFYSRADPEKKFEISVYPKIDLGKAAFDPAKPTAILIHGFTGSGYDSWMTELKDVYLQKIDANVMIVDWRKGAQILNYFQVVGNTRMVARQLKMFVEYLIQDHKANVKKFHLIGHSLGAQISSYLAKEVRGIGRLTALDPAQPGFELYSATVRLDKSDADFVEVVHTDAVPFIPNLGFGMIGRYGHVDFYMNGGMRQPGCKNPGEIIEIQTLLDLAKIPVEKIKDYVSCPHARAYLYLIEAYGTNGCTFWGHPASVAEMKGLQGTKDEAPKALQLSVTYSKSCNMQNCIPFGYETVDSKFRGAFVVDTNGEKPFCKPN